MCNWKYDEHAKEGVGLGSIVDITMLLIVFLLVGCANVEPRAQPPSSASSMFIAPAQDITVAKPPSRAKPEVPPEIKSKTLTLADCMKISLDRNPQTRVTWHATQSAAARVGEEKALYFPSVELALTDERADPTSFNNKETNGPGNTYEAGFGVRYLLFDGGTRSARVSSAEAELLAANFRHNTTLQDVALAVEEAYYELQAAKLVAKVAGETVTQTQYHVDLARARYKSGLVARSDILKAETEKANADLFLVKANSAVKIAMGRLARTMGMKVSQPFEVAEHPEDIRDRELASIDLLLDEAARNRPELRAILAQIEARRAEVKETEAQYWPVISIDGGYGSRDDTFVPSRDEWSIGISLGLPIFTGFDRTYRLQRARSELAAATAQYEELLRDVELEVWDAYLRIVEADQTIQASEKLVASAEESARVAEGEYSSGVGSIIEIIDAQTVRTTARTQLAQARLNWYTAIARFERAVGRILAEQEITTSKGSSSP